MSAPSGEYGDDPGERKASWARTQGAPICRSYGRDRGRGPAQSLRRQGTPYSPDGVLVVLFRRRRFQDLVERQLDLFRRENAGLVREVEAALAAYNRAPADEAEERYERFLDLMDTGRDALAEIRDTYARTLDPEEAEAYADEFNRLVQKRLRRFGLEIDD